MRTTLRVSLLVALGALFLLGCEDDPILEPNDGEKTDGGSYGKMHFVAPAAPALPRTSNPETF